jgi:hypothetical protein
MKFKVEFDCNNDAFAAFPEGEVEDILSKVAYAVTQGSVEGKVYDSNGNVVGSYEFSEE